MQTHSDEQLLDQYKESNDQAVLSNLYARYTDLVIGVCLRYTPSMSEAEDHAQDIYIKLIKKAGTHNIKNFKAWLYMVTKNHCLEQFRKIKLKSVDLDPADMQLADDMHPRDEQKEATLQKMETCLDSLSEQQRKCIDLFYYGNKTYREIESMTTFTSGKIRSLLQNGKRNLKNCMERTA